VKGFLWFTFSFSLSLFPLHSALSPERLTAARALPPEIAGRFRDLANLQQAREGFYYAFDRRSHSVHRIDPAWKSSKVIVNIGQARGELLEPSAFDSAADQFVVSDAPFGTDRIQVFFKDGTPMGAWQPQVRSLPRVTLGAAVLNGAGSLEFTGASILLSEPDSGWLVTEYGMDGRPRRHFGRLRATGHERDPDVHIALNTGVPLAAADGGFWFVFQAGVPMLRRYDAAGDLMFERHIEGTELDPILRALPSTWPRKQYDKTWQNRELPLIIPNVQTATVAPDGSLWIALSLGYVYVFDAAGDKIRVLELHGAGVVRPMSLAFSREGRLIVTPGGYEFDVPAKNVAAAGITP
jgi:hypothetical protein